MYKKDHNPPKKFTSSSYAATNKRCENHKLVIEEATKEAMEDAEINYYGLDDYLTGDKQHGKIFKLHYDEVYYENVDEEKSPKEFTIFES